MATERKNTTRNARRPTKSQAPYVQGKHSHTDYEKLMKEQELKKIQPKLI